MAHENATVKATRLTGGSRWPELRGLASVGLLLLLPLLVGSRFRTEPCCGVIAVDTEKGVATIRDNRTGRTWQFEAGADSKPATFSFPVSAAAKPAVPGVPCCSVIGVDRANGLVTIRDKATGLTRQFEAGTQAIRVMKEGDDVITGAGPGAPGTHIRSVGGIARSYALTDVAPITPCCGVSVINGGVTTVDKTTGASRHIAIDNPAAKAAIKVGQDVSMDASGKWAMFRLVVDGSPATYSFPVGGAGKKPVAPADTAPLWEIRPNAELRGALGRLVFAFNDADAIGGATILPAGQADGGKTVFIGDPSALPPGKYDVNVNGVIVKNVPIESGMETVMKVGVLSVTAGVKAAIFDKAKTAELKFVDGGKTVLPIGTYFLKVNGAFAKAVIREKQVTEF